MKCCYQQEGSLCAQHCLNALLQGSYFTAVDLAALAQELDEAERVRMAESGVDSEDYRRFLEVDLKTFELPCQFLLFHKKYKYYFSG